MVSSDSRKRLLSLAYCKSADFVVILVTMSDQRTIDAGAPDWESLLADDAAINRMADRLLAQTSYETGAVEIGGPWGAQTLVRAMIRAAAQPE